MRIFYKNLFEPINVIEIKDTNKSIGQLIDESIKDINIINNCEKYEIINDKFIEVKDLKKITKNDLYIQLTPKGETRSGQNVGIIAAAAIAGAGAGAAIGSVVPGVGTVAGGLLGKLIGGIVGIIGNFFISGGRRIADKSNASIANVKDKLEGNTILYGLQQKLTKAKPVALESKTLDPILASNKVSPNSVIPEVFGEFRFRPYQLTDLQRTRTSGRRRRNRSQRYTYNSIYSCGEGRIELSQPYFGNKTARDTEYTDSNFTYTEGDISTNINDLYSSGLLSGIGNFNLKLKDFDLENFTTEDVENIRDAYYSTRDTSGLKAEYNDERLCKRITLDLILSSRNVSGNTPSNWTDLFYKKVKRYVVGTNLTMGKTTVANNTIVGFSTTPFYRFTARKW